MPPPLLVVTVTLVPWLPMAPPAGAHRPSGETVLSLGARGQLSLPKQLEDKLMPLTAAHARSQEAYLSDDSQKGQAAPQGLRWRCHVHLLTGSL